jgi:hypothetical protein
MRPQDDVLLPYEHAEDKRDDEYCNSEDEVLLELRRGLRFGYTGYRPL